MGIKERGEIKFGHADNDNCPITSLGLIKRATKDLLDKIREERGRIDCISSFECAREV